MAKILGLKADVFFGDAEKPLPDWREEMAEEDDTDDDEPTEDEMKAVIGMLGFDPRE